MINNIDKNLEDENIDDSDDRTTNHSKCKMIDLQSNQKLLMTTLIHSNESTYCIVDANSEIDRDVYIIVECQYGKDLAVVNGEVFSKNKIPDKMISKIIRAATEKDLQKNEENLIKENEAIKTCKEMIGRHKLNMKLISAHYLFDEAKILFFFTADNRVDFRELVKDLVSIFKIRIELRQIGIRDESRIIGGRAICGRDYCCHAITDHLNPVSIKMAKEQNLSLNSMKISGPCGRLLCCLSYEYDFYKQERKLFPSIGTLITSEGNKLRVVELNIISHRVRLNGQDGQHLTLPLADLKFLHQQKKWIISQQDIEKKDIDSKELPEIKIESNETPSSLSQGRNLPPVDKKETSPKKEQERPQNSGRNRRNRNNYRKQ